MSGKRGSGCVFGTRCSDTQALKLNNFALSVRHELRAEPRWLSAVHLVLSPLCPLDGSRVSTEAMECEDRGLERRSPHGLTLTETEKVIRDEDVQLQAADRETSGTIPRSDLRRRPCKMTLQKF